MLSVTPKCEHRMVSLWLIMQRDNVNGTVVAHLTYRPIEMWRHMRKKPDFVFRRNGRVHLNRGGASVQSTTGSRDVRISGSNAGYTIFRSSVKSTGYPLHSPVSPSLSFPCVTVCHHISTGLYYCPFKREGTLGRCHTEKKTFSSSPYCYFQELPSPAIAYITGNKFVIS